MDPLTVRDVLRRLSEHDDIYKTEFTHGNVEIGIYKPEEIDLQTPHARDEVYVVATGSGSFIKDGNEKPVQVGDVLFVPAGVEHRFTDFTNDFSTWVFFYGPEGGGG